MRPINDTDIWLVIISITWYRSRDSPTLRYCSAQRSDNITQQQQFHECPTSKVLTAIPLTLCSCGSHIRRRYFVYRYCIFTTTWDHWVLQLHTSSWYPHRLIWESTLSFWTSFQVPSDCLTVLLQWKWKSSSSGTDFLKLSTWLLPSVGNYKFPEANSNYFKFGQFLRCGRCVVYTDRKKRHR